MYMEEIDKAISYAEAEQVVTNYNWNETLCNREVIAFGVGEFFESIHRMLFSLVDIKYLCDNNQCLWGHTRNGKEIVSPEFLRKKRDVFVVITTINPLDIMNQLKELDIEYIHVSEILFRWYAKGKDLAWLKNDYNQIKKCLDILTDDKSREVFVNIFCNKLRLSHSNQAYQTFCEDGGYFNNGLWHLNDDEFFLDGGAYIGDTIDKFLSITKRRFNTIYSFEVEKNNFKKLSSHINNEYQEFKKKIHLYNLGIWNEQIEGDTICYGDSDGVQIIPDKNISQITEKCNLVSLDEFLSNKRVTVLKFDIEGAEIQGIIGAREIIHQQKPKLAICLYHRPEDLWRIPCMINDLNPEYKIIIRHHYCFNFADTVLYAV